MAIISTLVLLTSFIGILGFGCWELDMEQIPVFYNFGQFLAYYWFHDRLKPGKAHYGNFSPDGPPLVAIAGTGTARPWPYNANTGPNLNSITFEENDQTPTSSKYDRSEIKGFTPVNGLYGVTNVKEGSRDRRLEYYPSAIEPNDYIARILLGDHADWTELVDMGTGGEPHLFNEKWFQYGGPFGAAEIGPGDPNNSKWDVKPRYYGPVAGQKLMVPLTSTGRGTQSGSIVNPYYANGEIRDSVRDYSGGEYDPTNTEYYNGSKERKFVSTGTEDLRPYWYRQDILGNILNGASEIAAWAGESGMNQNLQKPIDPGSSGAMVTYPTFYDPSVSSSIACSWGETAIGSNDPSRRYQFYNGQDPTTQQLDYIGTQLNTGTTTGYRPVDTDLYPKSEKLTEPQKRKPRRLSRSSQNW